MKLLLKSYAALALSLSLFSFCKAVEDENLLSSPLQFCEAEFAELERYLEEGARKEKPFKWIIELAVFLAQKEAIAVGEEKRETEEEAVLAEEGEAEEEDVVDSSVPFDSTKYLYNFIGYINQRANKDILLNHILYSTERIIMCEIDKSDFSDLFQAKEKCSKECSHEESFFIALENLCSAFEYRLEAINEEFRIYGHLHNFAAVMLSRLAKVSPHFDEKISKIFQNIDDPQAEERSAKIYDEVFNKHE